MECELCDGVSSHARKNNLMKIRENPCRGINIKFAAKVNSKQSINRNIFIALSINRFMLANDACSMNSEKSEKSKAHSGMFWVAVDGAHLNVNCSAEIEFFLLVVTAATQANWVPCFFCSFSNFSVRLCNELWLQLHRPSSFVVVAAAFSFKWNTKLWNKYWT